MTVKLRYKVEVRGELKIDFPTTKLTTETFPNKDWEEANLVYEATKEEVTNPNNTMLSFKRDKYYGLYVFLFAKLSCTSPIPDEDFKKTIRIRGEYIQIKGSKCL